MYIVINIDGQDGNTSSRRITEVKHLELRQFSAGVKDLPRHEALAPLSWLEGTWRCEKAQGSYPTIKDFEYGEEIKFVSVGQPMFNFSAFTWHHEKKTPMHQEAGFLKIVPGTNKVSLLLSHNFGLTTVEEGTVEGNGLKLMTSSVGRMNPARDPAVQKVHREFSFDPASGQLKQVSYMETSNTPLTKHLEAVYIKQ